MAEKVTPTFIIKLVVLFALLITSIFFRTKKTAISADAASVQIHRDQIDSNQVHQPVHLPYQEVTPSEKPHTPSI